MALKMRAAVAAGIEALRGENWRHHQERAATAGLYRFLDAHPELELYSAWRPGHVLEFLRYLTDDRGLNPCTANNYLNTLRLASRWVQLYDCDEWRQLFPRRIRASAPPPAKRFLMPDQVQQAIATAYQANDGAVVAAMTFGAMAGLRITEIVALRAEHIGDGTVAVRDAKNAWSERVVPLCGVAARFAAAWTLVHSAFPLVSTMALSHRVKKILDITAARTGDKSFALVDAHHATRTTFINVALHAGADREYLDAYVGHAPASVMARHYADMVPREADMPRIFAAKLLQMQARVTNFVDTVFSS